MSGFQKNRLKTREEFCFVPYYQKYIIFKNNIISLSREIVKLINQGIKVHQESKFTNDSKSNMCTNIVNKYIREKYQYNLSIEEMKFLNDNIENMSIN